jgi:hypothetical protein
MFLREQKGCDPNPSPAHAPRTQRSFRRRFGLEDGDNDLNVLDSSPKKRTPHTMTFAPFNQFKQVRADEHERYYSDNIRGRHRRGRSSSPVSPEVRELQGMLPSASLDEYTVYIASMGASLCN